jgi:glucose/arabinose dehydrogenase
LAKAAAPASAAERLSLRRQGEFRRTVQDDAGPIEAVRAAEVVVKGLQGERQHGDKGITFDGKGSLYVNVGAPSNACQTKDRQGEIARSGSLPHPGAARRHLEIRREQARADAGRRRALRHRLTSDAGHHVARRRALYCNEQSRSARRSVAGQFTAQENADRPAEPLYRAVQGSNFGWPFCFYDYGQKKFFTNPEYGGDGKTSDRCGVHAPRCRLPRALGAGGHHVLHRQAISQEISGAAFIAFHGSWNRAPLAQAGYNVTVQPFSGGKPSGDFEVFASGFTGKSPLMNPNDAVARPDGWRKRPMDRSTLATARRAASGTSSIGEISSRPPFLG